MKNKLFISGSVLALTLILSACDHYLDVNTDPTQQKTAAINQAFVSAESNMVFTVGSNLFIYSSEFAQQATGSGVTAAQTRDFDKYILTGTDVNTSYASFYSTPVADLDYVKKQGLAGKNPNYTGVAKLMQAYCFQNMVDAWGSVPYKQALKGVANVQPKYDDSKEIYDSLFVLIDNAIVQMKQTSVRAIAAEDFIYAGDLTKWEKFGNTLKLRLALNYAKDDAGTKLKALIAAGGPFMLSNADNFQMAFEAVQGRTNPINQFELSRQDYYAPAENIINLMNTKNDPRRGTYFTSVPTGTAAVPNVTTGPWIGTISNNTAQTVPNSRIHTYLRGAVTADALARATANGQANGTPTALSVTYTGATPIRMLLYAEYCFIRAEATLVYGAVATGNTSTLATNVPITTAEGWYQEGIRASFGNANANIAGSVSATDITNYLGAQGTLTTLQQIIEEKYVANYGVSMQPWTDWRRTNFPTLSPSAAGTSVGNTAIPRILVYPLSEQQTNLANLPTRTSMALKSVFWDK